MASNKTKLGVLFATFRAFVGPFLGVRARRLEPRPRPRPAL